MLLTHPALGHVAFFIETPGMDEGYDAINLQRARDIAAGHPLAALPPEAFQVPAFALPLRPRRATPRTCPLAEPA